MNPPLPDGPPKGLAAAGHNARYAVFSRAPKEREPARRRAGTLASDRDRERRLVERRALLEQRLHVLLPVARLAKPWERARERGVVPAARDPRRVVHEPQRAQRLDQAQLAEVELEELRVALEQVGELRLHLVARAREEQPEVLHR